MATRKTKSEESVEEPVAADQPVPETPEERNAQLTEAEVTEAEAEKNAAAKDAAGRRTNTDVVYNVEAPEGAQCPVCETLIGDNAVAVCVNRGDLSPLYFHSMCYGER